jgi:THO complex subunit 2
LATSTVPESVGLLERNDDTLPFAKGNQFVGLIAALLGLRCWDLAEQLIVILEERSVTVACIPCIRSALVALMNWRITDVLTPVGIARLKLASAPDSKTGDKMLGLSSVEADRVASQVTPGQCKKFRSLDRFAIEAAPLLSRIGLFVSESPQLLSGLCRVLKAFIKAVVPSSAEGLSQDREGEQVMAVMDADQILKLEPVLAIISNVLLSGLSCKESNAFLSSQVWEVLSPLPFSIRFGLYDRWRSCGLGKDALGLKPNELVDSETRALHNARAALKRLSKENTKAMGRAIAKHSHNCPLIVYNYILSQIESFDNLIPIIVDALRYSTQLSRDVMAYLMIAQLQKQDEKLKKGDTTYSQWFSSLSRFVATYYKKYPHTELKGLFHYLLGRLSAGDSLDLLVLRELLATMGGCETLLDLSASQLEALAGGRALRSHVVTVSAVNAAASNTSIRILREELMASGAALPMLLFIAQIRSRILHSMDTTHLKLISHMFDTAQDVLMQFTGLCEISLFALSLVMLTYCFVADFLVAGAKNIQTISTLMPSMTSLLTDSGLSLPVAFQLTRPLIRAAFQASEDPAQVPEHLRQWHPRSPEMLNVIRSNLPESLWDTVSVELVIFFWSFSLFDLVAPIKRYETEVKRLKERYSELDTKVIPAGTADADKLVKQRKSEMTKLLTDIKDLTDECETQRQHCEYIRKILDSRKSSFILLSADGNNTTSVWSLVVNQLLQHCVFDRLLMSPGDAVYSVQFFLLLHQLETPGFSTIVFMHQMIQTVAPLIFCSTEAEACLVGYAFNSLFHSLNSWFGNKVAFQLENQKAGFLTCVEAAPNAKDASSNAVDGASASVDSSASTDTKAPAVAAGGSGEAASSDPAAAAAPAEKTLKKSYITFEKYQLVCVVSTNTFGMF